MIKLDGSLTNVGIHESFLNKVLNDPNSTPALSQLWLVGMDATALAATHSYSLNRLKAYETENTWSIFNWKALSKAVYNGSEQYFLPAIGVNFPGDSTDVSRIGLNNFGAFKGIIGGGRADPVVTTIVFMESNLSFVDGLLRPWMACAAYNSMKDPKIRMPNISLTCFRKNLDVKGGLEYRKTITLKNATPISIDSEEQNYTGDKIMERQVQFVYDYYTTDLNSPLAPYAVVEPSSLSIRNIIEQAQDIYKTAKRTADDVQTAATRALRSVGLDKQANQVDKTFTNINKKVFKPVGTVITTGNKAYAGLLSAKAAVIPETKVGEIVAPKSFDARSIPPAPAKTSQMVVVGDEAVVTLPK